MNKTKPYPLYIQIIQDLKQDIFKGVLPAKAKIPTTAELCRQYGVCHRTIQMATRALVKEGLLIRRPRLGTYVADIEVEKRAMSGGERRVALLIRYKENLFDNDFYPREIIDGVIAAAEEYNCRIDFNVYSDLDSLSISPLLFGFLLVESSREQALKIKRMGLPVFLLDTVFERSGLGYARTDNIYGINQAVKHLVKMGHRKILYVYNDRIETSFAVAERYKGFIRAAAKYGIASAGYTVKVGDLKNGVATPFHTAMLVDAHSTTLSVLSILRKHGIRIPGDISLVAYDDISFSEYLSTPVTVVKQKLADIGRIGLEMLFSEDEKWRDARILVKPELIIRETTGYVNEREEM